MDLLQREREKKKTHQDGLWVVGTREVWALEEEELDN